MRPLSLDAVSGVALHSGVSTRRTASVSTSSTGRSRIAAAWVVNVCDHCHACLLFRHPVLCVSTNWSAQWPKLGLVLGFAAETLAARF